jgi:hypothetical protein
VERSADASGAARHQAARAAVETGEKDDMLTALRAVVSWDGMPPLQDAPAIAKARLLILLAEVFWG